MVWLVLQMQVMLSRKNCWPHNGNMIGKGHVLRSRWSRSLLKHIFLPSLPFTVSVEYIESMDGYSYCSTVDAHSVYVFSIFWSYNGHDIPYQHSRRSSIELQQIQGFIPDCM